MPKTVDRITQIPTFILSPVPLIPVVDMTQRKLVKVIRLPRGGVEEGAVSTPPKVEKNPLAHCTTSEYVPELRLDGVRKDLKELNAIQPDGPSFTVEDESLVSWQKWRFRVGFTPREGVVIHDVHYGGRSLFYRLSMSEMVSGTILRIEPQLTSTTNRLSPTLIHGTPSIASKPSISAREVQECVPTIWAWDVTA